MSSASESLAGGAAAVTWLTSGCWGYVAGGLVPSGRWSGRAWQGVEPLPVRDNGVFDSLFEYNTRHRHFLEDTPEPGACGRAPGSGGRI